MTAGNEDIKKSEAENFSEEEQIQNLMGLGESSLRKSYYPELQKKIKELEEEKGKFERIFSNALNGIFQADFSGKILVANPAMADLLGYTSQAELMKSVNVKENLFFTEEEKERLFREFRINGSIIGFETRFIQKDGQHVTVLLNASLSGELVEGFVQDITQRKHIEEYLKINEERLDLAMEVANEGLWDWDMEKDVFYFDPRYFTMAGYEPNEFPHDFSEWANRVHSDDINATLDTINAYVLKGHGYFDTEFRFLRKDGSWMWISSRGKIISWDKDGRPLRMLGTHTDITERKRSEIDLRMKDIIIHSAPVAISTTTSEGYISYVNPTFLELWGFSNPDEVLGTYFYDLWMAKEYKDAIRRDLSGKKEYWMGDVQARQKDGSLLDVQLFIARILDKEGNILGFTQTSVDISERKQVKEALEKRVLALTRPLSDPQNIVFEELFNLDDIQKLQDEFARATGVASMVIFPDGRPITAPTNFCRLCKNIIRKSEKGSINCMRSDAALGQYHPEGPIIEPCSSGGLWDAGTSITVGGKHIASWLIGQVRDDTQNEDKIRAYAREIGVDEDEAARAFYEVQPMSIEQFTDISQLLFTLSQQLSNIAYQNVQQARFISESRKNEEDLRQLRNYLSNIINSMPSILVGVDKTGRVTQWNSQAVYQVGISPEKAIGQPIEEVFPLLASEMGKVRQAMKTHQVLSELKKIRQDEGETRYEDLTIFPLISNSVEGAVIRIDDVTERVRIEEMMVQSEKMLSVGGLAAGMAHEINNPLAGMIQTANVLINRLDSKQNIPANLRAADEIGIHMEDIHAFMEKRDIPRMLTAIQESGKRVADIVQNMLSFARKSEALISTYLMDELLDKTIELAATDYNLKKHYDFRKIQINREYEENLPGVPCEAAKIQQVLLNILRNGAEAMQEAEIKEPHFILRTMYEKEQKFVRLEIEDNGPGMEEKVRKRVFEPFFTTKPPGVGTGLGLSVSYFIIVENHQGEIYVESHPGEGTKFVIRLPQERKLLYE